MFQFHFILPLHIVFPTFLEFPFPIFLNDALNNSIMTIVNKKEKFRLEILNFSIHVFLRRAALLVVRVNVSCSLSTGNLM